MSNCVRWSIRCWITTSAQLQHRTEHLGNATNFLVRLARVSDHARLPIFYLTHLFWGLKSSSWQTTHARVSTAVWWTHEVSLSGCFQVPFVGVLSCSVTFPQKKSFIHCEVKMHTAGVPEVHKGQPTPKHISAYFACLYRLQASSCVYATVQCMLLLAVVYNDVNRASPFIIKFEVRSLIAPSVACCACIQKS